MPDQGQFTVVRSEDDPEMSSTPDLRAVACRCGWRSVWVGAGQLTTTDGEPGPYLDVDEHAQLLLETLAQSTRHADH
jgi:hypothetical protein